MLRILMSRFATGRSITLVILIVRGFACTDLYNLTPKKFVHFLLFNICLKINRF